MVKVVVLGADYCPFCIKVKNHFQKNNIPMDYIDTQSADGSKRRAEQSKKHNWNTIPMVFIDDKFVGGCDDFFNKLKNKKLPGL